MIVYIVISYYTLMCLKDERKNRGTRTRPHYETESPILLETNGFHEYEDERNSLLLIVSAMILFISRNIDVLLGAPYLPNCVLFTSVFAITHLLCLFFVFRCCVTSVSNIICFIHYKKKLWHCGFSFGSALRLSNAKGLVWS